MIIFRIYHNLPQTGVYCYIFFRRFVIRKFTFVPISGYILIAYLCVCHLLKIIYGGLQKFSIYQGNYFYPVVLSI